MVRNCKNILLLLLIGAAGTAFASTPCGDNLEYTMDGTTLVLTSPNPAAPATISSQAFKDSTYITGIVFPDNLTVIYSAAFYGCTGITDIVLPPALTSIGVEAFRGCTSLVSVLCRPYDAPSLGTDGFTDCAPGLEICVPNLGSYSATGFWNNYDLTSCSFLDENDEVSVTESKISSARDDSETKIDIFRTLRKAGCFNTLTLPFNVPNITASPLAGAEVYEFVGASVVDGALQLDITPLSGNALAAGTPYLIQWDNTGEVMTRLSFEGITWDTDQTADNAGTGEVFLHGFYGKTHIEDATNGEQHLNLFLLGNNQLYWPTDGTDATAKMLGFRAWFEIYTPVVSHLPIRHGMPAALRIVATPTGIDSPFPSGEGRGEAATIVLRNGQLVIIRNGQSFSLNGQKL